MKPIILQTAGVTLAATLFLPNEAAWPPPWPAVIVLHGFAGSQASHAEFGEFLAAHGFAVLTLDQRGHGGSGGLMDAGILDDVGAALRFLPSVPGIDRRRIAVRGSSMGGNIAIHAADRYAQIAAVVAACPATEAMMEPWVASGRAEEESTALGLTVRLDREGLLSYLRSHDVRQAVAALSPRPLLLIQAKGDETVPYLSTVALFEAAREPKRLLLLEGGDHRSAQHDPAVHRETVAWLTKVMRKA
jgi:putative redox protein